MSAYLFVALVAVSLGTLQCATESTFYEYPAEDGCPNINPKSINATEYAGPWYDVYHTDYSIYLCSMFNVEFLDEPGETFPYGTSRANTVYPEDKITLNDVSWIRILSTTQDTVTSFTEQGKKILNYYVLDTDYKNFSIEFQCVVKDGKKLVVVRLITRKLELNQKYLDILKEVLRKNNIEDVQMNGSTTNCNPLYTICEGKSRTTHVTF